MCKLVTGDQGVDLLFLLSGGKKDTITVEEHLSKIIGSTIKNKMQKLKKQFNSKLTKSLILLFGMFFAASASAASLSDEIVENVNIERQKQGKNILERSEALDKAAMLKAKDMIGNNYFAHTSPEGVDPWHWIEKVDYQYKYAGENLAMDFKTANGVHKAWMKSPAHRDNIVAEKYTEIGVAVLRGIVEDGKSETNIAVQLFATPFAEERIVKEQAAKDGDDKKNEIGTLNGEKIEILEATVRPWEGEEKDEMLIYTKVSGEVEEVTVFIGKEKHQLEKLPEGKYMNLVELDKENLKENKIIVRVDINEEKAIFHHVPKYQYLDYLENEKEEKEEKQAIIASVKDVSSGIGNDMIVSHNIVLAGFVLVCLVMVANVWILEKEEARLLDECQTEE